MRIVQCAALLAVLVCSYGVSCNSGSTSVSTASRLRLGKIPASAQVVFHHNKQIYVMNADGSVRTQITFDTRRSYQHVAVSPDRRYVVANYDATDGLPHPSKLVVYDLAQGRELSPVERFQMAGNGGVDMDPQGRIYFAGVEKLPYPLPMTGTESAANAGANDVWRVRVDGTGLERLTNTPDKGEADVSVHPSGMAFTYNAHDLTTLLLELWVAPNGVPQRVFVALDAIRGAFDPELSPDATEVVFSMRNPDFVNFPDDPNANTAHDIYRIKTDGTGLTRVTEPGPISILPDWKEKEILYMHMSDRTTPPWGGMIVRSVEGVELRRVNDVNMPKWIP